VRRTEPDSAWWGDGAAAVVIGPVARDRGLLSTVHRADGSSCDALVMGVPGHRWWHDGAIQLHSANREHTRAMLLAIVDRARDAIATCLAEAKLAAADVGFYASHQGTVWLTDTTARHAGLAHARTVTTFPSLGNLNSANIPFVLDAGVRAGSLRDGDIVVTFSGGIGETWSSMCMRWGR
jgi:3-oxoacyl-[acyl-carrier-protein] synthase III